MRKTKYSLLLCLVMLACLTLLGACSLRVSYKLYFRVDDEVYATISTTGDEVIKIPEDPEKEGYNFDGWYWDKGTWEKPFTANSLLDAPISNNMSVYAKFVSENEHTHIFDKEISEEKYLVSAVSCTSGAVYYKSCECEEAGTETFEIGEPLGHSFTNYVSDNNATCTADGTKTAKCDKCNEVDTITEEGTMTDHTIVIDNAVEPTCTEKGKTEGKHCSVCNAVIIAQQDINAKGHTEVIDNAVAPTCTEKGKTEGKHCSVCNAVIVAQQEVNAKGHTEVIDNAVEPTCTEKGKTEGKHCSVCNAVIIAQQDINATGHSYSADWSKNETYHWHSANCEHAGEVSGKAQHSYNNEFICTVCDYVDIAAKTLQAPTITKVEYDTVYWEPVKNAESYTVWATDSRGIVFKNKDEQPIEGTACRLKDLKNGDDSITDYGIVSIKVKANDNDIYSESGWSEINDSYFYVPETNTSLVSTLTNFSIGFGYNVIEDDYLDITQCSKKSVFNVGKLLTIGEYATRANASGKGSSYNYSTIDEFISKTKVSFEYGQTAGCVLLGSAKMQINADIGFDYSKYEYNNNFVYEYSITYKDHKITNFSNDNLLAYCLSDNFLKDIRKEKGSETEWMTDDQLVEYLFNTYGTHAILGITTGGSFYANYTISTTKKNIATDVKLGFSTAVEGGGAIDQIVQCDFNISASVQEEINSNKEETKSKFTTYYYGGSGGATNSPDGVEAALRTWSSSMKEDTARSIKFTKDGAISIVSLLSYIDYSLASKLDNYINAKADETYRELFDKFTKSANLPVDMETENGVNTLVINLSNFQEAGNINNVTYPSLDNNVLTITPTMLAKDINIVKVIGAYNTYDKPIDSLSLKLSEDWNKDVILVLENVGVYTSGENGFIDISAVNQKIKVNIDYIGRNAILGQDGTNSSQPQSALVLGDLNITSSDVNSSLTIYAGNGIDATKAGGTGQNGAVAIIANNITIDSVGSIEIFGGNGGNGKNAASTGAAGGNGGNGGDGIVAVNLTVNSVMVLNITGGTGGNGNMGGQGYRGTDGDRKDVWYSTAPSGTDGGSGGSGGSGGAGGYAIKVLDANSNSIIFGKGKVNLIGGNSGNGGKGGKGGTGGTGGYTNSWYSTGGNGGNGGKGGKGGNAYAGTEASNVEIISNSDDVIISSGTTGKVGAGGEAGNGGNAGKNDGGSGCPGKKDGSHGGTYGVGESGIILGPVAEITYNGHRYVLYRGKYSWNDAKAKAESLGGHLVVITSDEENSKMAELIKSNGINAVWGGATDVDKENNWKWVNAEEWSYTSWNSDEPNNNSGNGPENYLGIYQTGKWNDYAETTQHVDGFIVEYD